MAAKWNDIYQGIIDKSIESKIPVSGFFELTSRCNLHCRMCYVCNAAEDKHLQDEELTTEQWITMGKEARDAGLLFLTLTGGEIFIRKDFWEIYEAYTQMGFNVTLFTNGTLVNNERVRRLAKNPPSKVSITIYGAGPETYGKVTGHPEAYEKTIANIKALLSEGIKVELKTTLVQYNRNEFKALAELTQSMGITIGVVNYISPRREGTGTDPEANRLDPYDLAEYEKMMEKYNIERNQLKPKALEHRVKIDNEIMTDITSEDTEMEKTKASQKSAFRCSAGKCAFWLTWNGKLAPCGLLNDPYAEPLKVGFLNAWQQLKESCEYVPVCMECENCVLRSKCMTCPARLKAETGFFDKPASYLCEHTKARSILNVPY